MAILDTAWQTALTELKNAIQIRHANPEYRPITVLAAIEYLETNGLPPSHDIPVEKILERFRGYVHHGQRVLIAL